MTAPNQWARYLTYRGLAALLQVIPRPLAAGLASAAGFTISELWRDKRPLVRANLRRVLGPAVDEATMDRLVTGAFSSYAHYWVESARVVALRSDQIESTFSIEGFERFRVEMARGRGVVIALPHVGSWEYGGRWLAQQGYPMTTVGELLEPPELFDWFTSQRAALGLTVLPPGPDTSVRLLDTLRAGRVVGLLADRDLVGNGVEVEFFGEKTTLPAGPALLALRSGAPLMTCAIYQRPRGLYHAVLQPPLDSTRSGRLRQDLQRLTEEMAGGLEDLIALAPEQWHLFQPNWPSDRAEGL
ncbi:MAG: phosphatidylinositol mannoside acyltransferase [Acidimicrobiales bacterium]